MATLNQILCLVVCICIGYTEATVVRSCEGQSLTITCNEGEIRINSANYGRTAGGEICPSPSVSDTNCYSANSLSYVQGQCDGKVSCTILASNSVFGDPCQHTHKYLEVEYRCGEVSRVCEGSSLSLRCPSGQFIKILDGFYGRMAGSEICPHSKIQTQNCKASSSMSVLLSQCDGKNSCTVSASNGVFGGDPCEHTYKYLEVLYDCA